MFPSTLAISWIILAFIFILSATLLWKQYQHDRKQPPGPPAMPILGHLHILGNLPHSTLQTLSKRYGPIMSLRLGQVPTIVVTSPEAAEQFLKTQESVFASRPIPEASKYLSYLLSALKVESFAPLRKQEVEAAVKLIQKEARVGEALDLSEVVQGVLEDIVYKMVLGCSKDDKFYLKGLIQDAMLLAGKFNVTDYVPWLGILDIQV
ncbi:Cytochrome P450 [Sesbania bispinosa]|nr:Cytochrome P450 [Sesbania bispinosa]